MSIAIRLYGTISYQVCSLVKANFVKAKIVVLSLNKWSNDSLVIIILWLKNIVLSCKSFPNLSGRKLILLKMEGNLAPLRGRSSHVRGSWRVSWGKSSEILRPMDKLIGTGWMSAITSLLLSRTFWIVSVLNTTTAKPSRNKNKLSFNILYFLKSKQIFYVGRLSQSKESAS